MERKMAKDIMRALDECAVVRDDSTLADAIIALEEAQDKLPPGRQKHGAVLVEDEKGKIVGKLGYLGFLKALEPKYGDSIDVERLARAGVGTELISVIMDGFSFWQDDIEAVRQRAHTVKVKDAMIRIEDSVDVNCTLPKAIHHLIMKQSLSVVVKMGGIAVGILRLSDLFDEVAALIKSSSESE